MGIFKQALINDYEREMPYFLWLNSVGDIGIKTYTRMQSYFGAPSEVYRASLEKLISSNIFTKKQLARIKQLASCYDPVREYEKMTDKGIVLIPREDSKFPKKLLDIPSSPIGIFVKGKLPDYEKTIVSVIGARECSLYGAQVAARLGELFAQNDITLVSGMARGIDSISQDACVRAGGTSIAVLGGGVDIVYPRESSKLYEALCENGSIISEFAPGIVPLPQYFALRNRIISGLSDVVCVVEAKEKSGTMITVDAALEQGREVYAVPGKITDITSRGCNDLIKQGAGMISDLEGFVMEIAKVYQLTEHTTNVECTNNMEETRKDYELDLLSERLNDEEKRMLISMDENSFTGEELSRYIGCAPGLTLEYLLRMSSQKLLINMGAGRFRISSMGMDIKRKILQDVK